MRIGQEILNRGGLVLAFVIGCGGILYLKLQEFPIYVTIGFPIAVLFVYWLAALTISDKRIYEMVGDNCYYLGFVFTLTSLAVTLYLLYDSADAARENQLLPETISGFGVALSSTIVGIVLRVVMQRMTPDISQQESEARVDLDLAIRDFRTHLSMSIGELKRYSVETSQILVEQRDAVQEQLAQDSDAHTRATEARTATLTKFAEDTERKLADHRAAMQESMEHDALAYREAVQQGITAFREALDRVSSALSNGEAQVRDALRQSVESQLQALEGGAAGLHGVLERTVEAFAEYQKEAGQLASLSRTTFEQTGESVEAARNVLERLKALTEGTAALSSENRSLDTALSGVIGKLATVEDGIATKLEPSVARISEGATAISAVLADSSGKLKSAAECFEAAAERTAAADMQTNIAAASERIAGATERLETANVVMSSAIEKLGELADRAVEPRRAGILGVFSTRRGR